VSVGAPKVMRVACLRGAVVMLTDMGLVRMLRGQSSGPTVDECENFNAVLGDSGRFVDVAAGSFHAGVVTASGEAFVWYDEYSQRPPNTVSRSTNEQFHGAIGALTSEEGPQPGWPVACPPTRVVLPDDGTSENANGDASTAKLIRGIRCGAKHTAVFTNDGQVYCWGRNERGQCAMIPDFSPRGERDIVALPMCVGGPLSMRSAADVQLGFEFSVCLTTSGEVWAWGSNSFGQLGVGDCNPRAAPERVPTLCGIGVTQLSCGNHHLAAITAQGDVFTCGSNNFKQLGVPNEQADHISLPRLVPALRPQNLRGNCVHSIACGSNHTVVLSGPANTLGVDLERLLSEEIVRELGLDSATDDISAEPVTFAAHDLADALLCVPSDPPKKYRVHRGVLCARSSYFRSQFGAAPTARGSDGTGSTDPVEVELPSTADDSQAVAQVLRFLYCAALPPMPTAGRGGIAPGDSPGPQPS
jgi:alpha-tubulin suppressor-like RCC1 family protein